MASESSPRPAPEPSAAVRPAACAPDLPLAMECLSCQVPEVLPILILKSVVPFPLQVVSTQITRSFNLHALRDLAEGEALIAAAGLVNPEESYSRSNIGEIAVACRVLSRVEMAGGSLQVVLQGMRRIRLDRFVSSRPSYRANASCPEEPAPPPDRERRLTAELLGSLEELIRVDPRHPEELLRVAQLNQDSGARCADLLADRLPFGYSDRRRVVEALDVEERMVLVASLVQDEIARARIRGEVMAKTEVSHDLARRKALLREQLEVIQQELDVLDPRAGAVRELVRRIDAASLPEIVAEEARRQVERLRASSVDCLEGSSIRAYVEWVLSIPWQHVTPTRPDLRRAKRLLDKRHPGLGEARDQLLEFLAIQKLGGKPRGTVLAILGPPGTGRTTLARTLADALARPFVRISMRGIRDEADLRGTPHSEPVARPGEILEALRQAGARNPVLLFDDLDLLDGRGTDLTSAILGALDPSRNFRFRDHYLGVPFDLSGALFVVTACIADDIPNQLWDRVEAIELSGYTERVKVAIARAHTWPQAIEAGGIEAYSPRITDAAIRRIIRQYTREAGLRELSDMLEAICRQFAVQASRGGRPRLAVNARNLESFLGPPSYIEALGAKQPQIGAATGLAWTESGGDLLPIEALLMPGEGRMILTGLLGEVMQESVAAALSYVRSRAADLGIPVEVFQASDIHVHFPEGAIPKDGPSGGIAVATTIASLLSRRGVRQDVAMTGEISLRGAVLPIGGLREKILAAERAGIRHVILPKGNASDYESVPREIRGRVRPHLVSNAEEVFQVALRPAKRRRA